LAVYMLVLIGLLGQSSSVRSPQLTILMIDGRALEGVIRSGAVPGQLSLESNGGKSTIDSIDVDRIDVHGEPIQTKAGPWQVCLLNGSRLSGQIVAGGAEKLTLRHALLGDVPIPLDQLKDMRRSDSASDPGSRDDIKGSDKDDDSLLLLNGDALRGSVEEITPGAVLVMSGEQERRVPLESIRQLRLTNPSKAQVVNVRIMLANGSIVASAKARWDDRKLKIDWFESQLEIASEHVVWMETVGGRRVWLSELPVHTSVDIPYFDKAWPMRVDLNAVGGPLSIDGKRYQRGIGLHSAGRWTWQLAGDYERFRGILGMDNSAGTLVDADFTISLDGRQLVEYKGLRHGGVAKKLDLDVSGGRELVIEVGFGKNGPVQDRVNLVNAALIKAQSGQKPGNQDK
jgi:sRNA-binding regulator protein Hfq